MPIQLAHQLTHKLAEVRKKNVVDFLRPDGKSQVTVEYIGGRPARVDAVVISTQHSDTVSQKTCSDAVIEEVIKPVIPADMFDKNTKVYVNPTGRFVIGGPMGDAGLTGRKIIVDTYGGYGRHGGGAFSGKDPIKVDRSACYMARYVAKNIVAAGLARKVEVQLAYAIGVAEPVSVMADTFGTGTIPERPDHRADSRNSSSSRPRASSKRSICAARFIVPPRPTAISAAPARASPGSAPIRRTPSARQAGICASAVAVTPLGSRIRDSSGLAISRTRRLLSKSKGSTRGNSQAQAT